VADGELYVSGREKDLIIIRGSNHAAQEFEDCLAGIEGVRTGCAVALGFVPDEERGEQLLVLAERPRSVGSNATMPTSRASSGWRSWSAPASSRTRYGSSSRDAAANLQRKLRRAEALRQFLAGELMPPRKAGFARLSLEVIRSTCAFVRVRFNRES